MAGGNFGGGDGTELNPYLVEDAYDMTAINNDQSVHYKQVADIDLQGLEWHPFSYFTGVFDGDNYVISNLFIDMPEENYIALFGYTENATVKNIKIQNANVTGSYYVGMLIGMATDCTIDNCRVEGIVNSLYGCVGGLAGLIIGSGSEVTNTLNRCSSNATVIAGEGSPYVGGLVGEIATANVNKCISDGAITAGYDSSMIGGLFGSCDYYVYISNSYTMCNATGGDLVGGLIGYMSESTATNCYAVNEVTATITEYETDVGGLVGYIDSSTVGSSYYNNDINGLTDTDKGLPKTTEELKKQVTFIDWDFENIWSIRENETYPYFATRSTGQLQAMPLTSITVVN